MNGNRMGWEFRDTAAGCLGAADLVMHTNKMGIDICMSVI